jgi:hypothetical protein
MAKEKIQVLEDAPPLEISSAVKRAEKREDTRSKIALYYVLGFLGIVCICFIVAGIEKFDVNDTRDLLVSVSGILSGPLGFIIGYYFKSHSKDD